MASANILRNSVRVPRNLDKGMERFKLQKNGGYYAESTAIIGSFNPVVSIDNLIMQLTSFSFRIITFLKYRDVRNYQMVDHFSRENLVKLCHLQTIMTSKEISAVENHQKLIAFLD